MDLTWHVKNGDVSELKGLFANNKNIKVDDPEICGGRPAIVSAADYGQDEVVKFLLAHNADVNVKDKHGITALLAAIWEGHKSTVQLLILHNANFTDFESPRGKKYIEEADKDEIKQLLK